MSDNDMQEFEGDEACGARAVGGPCVLRRAHNMGQLDIPSAHQASRKTPRLGGARHLNAQDVADAVRRLQDKVAACGADIATDLRTVTEAALQRDFYYRAAFTIEDDIQTTLAKALGYPEYQPGEPGYSPHGPAYVIGDHVAGSLALEAAGRIAELTAKVEAARSALAEDRYFILLPNVAGNAAADRRRVADARLALDGSHLSRWHS